MPPSSIRVWLFGSFLAATATAFGQLLPPPKSGFVDPETDFVVYGDEAVGLLPPQTVCGSLARYAKWSSDGRYLLVVREHPKSERAVANELGKGVRPDWDARMAQEVLVWDKTTGKSRSLVRYDLQRSKGLWPYWLRGTDRVVLTSKILGQTPSTRIEIVSAATGVSRPLFDVPGNLATVRTSPDEPQGVFTQTIVNPDGTSHVEAILFGANGAFGETARFDLAPGELTNGVGYGEDGSGPHLVVTKRGETGRLPTRTFSYDRASRKFFERKDRWVSIADSFAPPHPKGREIALEPLVIAVGRKPYALLLLIGEGQDRERLVVSADAEGGELSPTGEVAYFHRGALLCRTAVTMTKAAYEKLKGNPVENRS